MARTYEDLQQGILRWGYLRLEDNRHPQLEGALDDIIRMAEGMLYHGWSPDPSPNSAAGLDRGLRVPEMLSVSTITILGGSGELILPADCLEWVKVSQTDANRPIPTLTSFQTIKGMRAGHRLRGSTERFYCATPDTLLVAPVNTDDEDWDVIYYQQPQHMTQNGEEPTFLEKYYHVYLAAGVLAVARFLGNVGAIDEAQRELLSSMMPITGRTRQRWGALA